MILWHSYCSYIHTEIALLSFSGKYKKTGALSGNTEVITKRKYYIFFINQAIPSRIYTPQKKSQSRDIVLYL
jgi:hypothetical protein